MVRRARKYQIKKKFRGRGLSSNQKAQVSRLINRRSERKYHNFLLSAGRDYSGSVNDLSVISQGDGGTSRDGDSLYLLSCRAKITFELGDTTNLCRCIIFQSHQNTTPVPSDIIDGTYVGTTEAPLASYNSTQKRMFSVLYDKTVALHTYKPIVEYDTGYLKIKRRKVKFNLASTAGQNKIWLLFITDSGAVAHPTCTILGRTTFSDS